MRTVIVVSPLHLLRVVQGIVLPSAVGLAASSVAAEPPPPGILRVPLPLGPLHFIEPIPVPPPTAPLLPLLPSTRVTPLCVAVAVVAPPVPVASARPVRVTIAPVPVPVPLLAARFESVPSGGPRAGS